MKGPADELWRQTYSAELDLARVGDLPAIGNRMTALNSARAIAVMSSGLMAGLLFGDWLGPSFARSAMNESSFIQFQQIVHLNYLRTLPALSTLALATPVLWLIMLRNHRRNAEFKLLVGATVAIALGSMITLIFNVPINDQLETWSFATPPADAREIWNGWEKAHIVRTVFWVAGFVLEIMALTSSASRSVTPAGVVSQEMSG